MICRHFNKIVRRMTLNERVLVLASHAALWWVDESHVICLVCSCVTHKKCHQLVVSKCPGVKVENKTNYNDKVSSANFLLSFVIRGDHNRCFKLLAILTVFGLVFLWVPHRAHLYWIWPTWRLQSSRLTSSTNIILSWQQYGAAYYAHGILWESYS